MRTTQLVTLISATVLAVTLASCGSDNKDKRSNNGSATGTFTDSPVAGVQYSTSSGVSGTTNSSGQFQYNPGDTVTFKIGSLTLGQAMTSGSQAIVTPLQLAQAASSLSTEQQQNMVTNLLVLLQSLDSDSDANNGITIPGAVATALSSSVAATLNLSEAAATFAQNPTLSSLISTAGGSLVSPEEALAHFEAQFLQDLAGVYIMDLGNELVAFRFNSDGSYLMGEIAEADLAGQSGIERGRIDWNPQTGEINASDITLDTSGEWGLSHPVNEHHFFSLNGGNLIIKLDYEDPSKTDETFEFARLQQSSGIVGAWAAQLGEDPARNLGTPQFLFLSNGKYLMLDPVGDDDFSEPDDPKCGGEGLEYGSYSLSNGTLSTSNIIEDTNDCAGLHDSDTNSYSSFNPVSINNDGNNISLGGEIQLIRINTQAAP